MASACYVTIEGQKQGKFKAEASFSKFGSDKITVISCSFGVVVPFDAATGQAAGKRQHQTVKFTKLRGAASPQLFSAATSNETLTSVVFSFTHTSGQGKEEVHYVVTLTNATIVRLSSHVDLGTRTGSPFDAHELDDVELTFEKIEIEEKSGATTASDDWETSN